MSKPAQIITAGGKKVWEVRMTIAQEGEKRRWIRRQFATKAEANAELRRLEREKRAALLPVALPEISETKIREVRNVAGQARWEIRKYVGFSDDRRQIRRRFPTMAEAQEALAHMEATCTCTVGAVLDQYLTTTSLTAKTLACYASQLAPVRDAFGNWTLVSITPDDMARFRADLAASVKTNGPGRGEPKSEESIHRTVERFQSALNSHYEGTRRWSGTGRKPARRVAFIYVIGAVGSPLVKIGRAVDVNHRLQNLQSGSPLPLVLLGSFEGHDTVALERSLHLELAAARRHGEWFDLGPDPLAVVNALVQV